MRGMSDINAHIAAVLLQLGATDDEIDAAWQVMRTWPAALEQVRSQ